MNPQQAFEILLNIPEPRRTLVLTDAGDSSASIGDSRSDVDGSGPFRSGDRSEPRLRLGPVQSAQVQGLEGTRTHAPRAGRFLDGVEGENSLCEG